MAKAKTKKKAPARANGTTANKLEALLKKGCTTKEYAAAAGIEVATARLRLHEALEAGRITRYLPDFTPADHKRRAGTKLLSVGSAVPVRREPHYKFV